MAVTCVYRCLQFRSLVAITYIAYEGEGRVTEVPPPKSLEEEPGNVMTYSLNDILDDVIAHHQWMM